MATFALLIYPLLAMLLFRTLPFRHGLVAVILGGMLLLPSSFRIAFDGLPDIDRKVVTVAALLLCIVIYHADYVRELRNAPDRERLLPGWIPREPVVLLLLLMVVLAQLFTFATNTDPTNIGWQPQHVRPGLTLWDLPSTAFHIVLPLIVFLAGRRYFCTPEGHRILLATFVIAALIYTLPALWEIRMSPRLHAQVYGFFPHSWLQTFRGGWRPQVFFGHGLQLALFNAMAILGALVLWKSAPPERGVAYLMIAMWIGATLVLSNSLGALMIATVLVPVIILLSPRLQTIAAASIVAVVLLYPMLRGAGISPLQPVVDYLQASGHGKAGSLWFRLKQEGLTLERASERPLFGWGGWGRWQVIEDGAPRARAVDGHWAITIGTFGWFGFIALYGLKAVGVLAHARPKLLRAIPPVTAGMTVVLAANLFDLIPNSFVSPLTWLLAGALAGHVEYVRAFGAAPAGGAYPASLRAGPMPAPARARSQAPADGGGGDGSEATVQQDGGGSRYTRFAKRASTRRKPRNA
mgnify:FL=1